VFGNEGPVLAEDLQAVVGAVTDVDEAVLVDTDAVHRVAELLRRRLGRIVWRRLLVAGRFAIGAPVALVGAGLGIEHDHTPVAVAIGREHFLRGDVHRNVGRRPQSLGRIAVVALARLADLQDELALHGELEELSVLLAVAGKPDEIIGVDEDAVLALGPLIALPRSAPVTEQVAGLVEYEHRRRGNTASRFRRILFGRTFAWRQRSRPVHHPDPIILVGGDTGDLPEQPVVRQR